jgi:hypothetical protein
MYFDAARAKVEKHLRQTIPDEIWDYVEERSIIDDCMTGGALDVDALADEVKLLFKHFGRRTSEAIQRDVGNMPVSDGGMVTSISRAADLDTYEARRASAYSEYVAWVAAELPAAKSVREDVLAGSLMPLPNAIAWLQSPAVRLFPAWLLEQKGIPLVGHTAAVMARAAGEHGPVKIRVQPGDVVLGAAERPPSAYGTLEYPDGHDGISVTRYARFSVVDKVAQAARALTRTLPWEESQAVGYLLCGMTPFISPLGVGYRHRLGQVEHATITLTAEPWVSALVVEAAYRKMQKEMLGRENRPLTGLGLDILHFCIARIGGPGGANPTWATLMEAWNAENRDRPYNHRRRFARDFSRAQRQLRRPGYFARRSGQLAARDSQTDSQLSGDNAFNAE